MAGGIVDAGAITPTVVLGGLIGAIAWNLGTWWFGLPSSSSHALIGGVVSATFVAAGSDAVAAYVARATGTHWLAADASHQGLAADQSPRHQVCLLPLGRA